MPSFVSYLLMCSCALFLPFAAKILKSFLFFLPFIARVSFYFNLERMDGCMVQSFKIFQSFKVKNIRWTTFESLKIDPIKPLDRMVKKSYAEGLTRKVMKEKEISKIVS